jgi:hypothetical protein
MAGFGIGSAEPSGQGFGYLALLYQLVRPWSPIWDNTRQWEVHQVLLGTGDNHEECQCRIWGSHCGGYEESYLLGYNAVQSIESQPTFRRNMSPTSAGSKKKSSSACHLLSRWFLTRLILRPWRLRRHVPPKRQLTFNWLHGAISQKIWLLNVTATARLMPLPEKGSITLRPCYHSKHRTGQLWRFNLSTAEVRPLSELRACRGQSQRRCLFADPLLGYRLLPVLEWRQSDCMNQRERSGRGSQ